MTDFGPIPTSEMIDQLVAAGWFPIRHDLWRSPAGTRHFGPRAAWMVGPGRRYIAQQARREARMKHLRADDVGNPNQQLAYFQNQLAKPTIGADRRQRYTSAVTRLNAQLSRQRRAS